MPPDFDHDKVCDSNRLVPTKEEEMKWSILQNVYIMVTASNTWINHATCLGQSCQSVPDLVVLTCIHQIVLYNHAT